MPTSSPLQTLYYAVLGLASGFSLGWFSWVIASRQIADPPFWPFAAAGVLVGLALTRMAAASRWRRWTHVLWIPVAAFVLLMAAIILALRSMGG